MFFSQLVDGNAFKELSNFDCLTTDGLTGARDVDIA